MYKRKIIDEVSVNEMIQMRESVMSNAEVAQALDVSYSTVLNYLGKNPPGTKRKRKKHSVAEVATVTVPSPEPEVPEVEAPNPAALTLDQFIVSMRGERHHYEINLTYNALFIDGSFTIEYETLGNLIAELQAIHNLYGDSLEGYAKAESWRAGNGRNH